jgi:hypothetical protein
MHEPCKEAREREREDGNKRCEEKEISREQSKKKRFQPTEMSTERDVRKADADKRFGRQMAALSSYTFTPLFYRFPGFWKLPPPGLPALYSDGLKLRMPGPSSSRPLKNAAAGAKS